MISRNLFGKPLSEMEKRLLFDIASGKTMRCVAVEMQQSERTIESRRSSLCRKLGVNNTASLLLKGIKAGHLNLKTLLKTV